MFPLQSKRGACPSHQPLLPSETGLENHGCLPQHRHNGRWHLGERGLFQMGKIWKPRVIFMRKDLQLSWHSFHSESCLALRGAWHMHEAAATAIITEQRENQCSLSSGGWKSRTMHWDSWWFLRPRLWLADGHLSHQSSCGLSMVCVLSSSNKDPRYWPHFTLITILMALSRLRHWALGVSVGIWKGTQFSP